MPRTKKPSTKKAANNAPQDDDDALNKIISSLIDEAEEQMLLSLQNNLKKELDMLDCQGAAFLLSLPKGLLNRTIGETRRGEVNIDMMWNSRTILGNSTLANTFLSTKSTIKKDTRNRLKNSASRSVTDCDDEGYTTAESTRGTTSGASRQSRSQTVTRSRLSKSLPRSNLTSGIKLPTSRKMSNSCDRATTNEVPGSSRQSRSKAKESTLASRSNSRAAVKNLPSTPLNRQPPNKTGTITPKCKPNTPLLFMRRPKVGEMAWSNQGSPLLVYGATAQDRTANVNIPIGDDVLSIMPTRRPLNQLEIPNIEGDTKRQLEALRDNLIAVITQSEARNKK